MTHVNRLTALMSAAAAAVAALTAAVPPASATTTVYDSLGFETPKFTTGALTGQDGKTWIESGGSTAGSAVVESAAAFNGTQAVQVTRVAPFSTGGDKRYWPNTAAITPTAALPQVTVSWDMNVAANNTAGVTTGPFFGIEAYGTGAARIAGAGVDAHTGEVLFQDSALAGGFNSTPADDTVSLGAWHHFLLSMNFTAHTAAVYVDGSLRYTVPTFLSSNVTQFADADLSALAAAAEPTTETGLALFDNYSVVLGPAGAAPVTVNSGQTYHFPAGTGSGITATGVGGLTVNATGIAIVDAAASAANRQLLFVTGTGLALAGSTNAWTGRLEMGNNDMDLPGGSLATVTNQLRQGFNGGSWSSTGGITSTTAAADPTHLTALGVLQNNQAGSAIYTSFDGQPVGASDILVRSTYYGDTNLDGVVNAADYTRIDAGYIAHLTGWANGDFNFDGVVDGSDYTLMDNAFDLQPSAGPSALVASSDPLAGPLALLADDVAASVPEPSSLALAVLIGTATLGRSARRRG